MNLTRVAVAGSTGYSGQELVKLLNRHGSFELVARIGREDRLEDLAGKVDLAFLCTPNEISLEMAPRLLAHGIHVVDVAGSFRLKKHSYKEWYGFEHSAPGWLEKSEYGLYPWKKVEAVKAGQEPRLIANPGCFVTAATMTLIPLVQSGLVQTGSIVIDAKSGTTGAGRKAETRLLFSEIEGEFAPYKVGRHQHWPEIVEGVEMFTGVQISPVFVTELLPVARGISSAIFGEWTSSAAQLPDRLEQLVEAFRTAYRGQPDISVGMDASLSSMKSVVNTNRIHIQIAEAFKRPVIFTVIDNLVRGAAGQALINANLLAGFHAHKGLS